MYGFLFVLLLRYEDWSSWVEMSMEVGVGNQGGHLSLRFIESGWVGMGVEMVGRESGWSLLFAFHRVTVGGVGGGG